MDSEMVKHSGGEIDEPWTAARVIGNVVLSCRAMSLDIPPSWKGIIGAHAKSMLADGIRPDIIVAACHLSILRARPQVAQYIAGDLLLAEAGLRMDRSEYEQKVAMFAAGKKGNGLLEEQRERLAQREVEIERRRNGGS